MGPSRLVLVGRAAAAAAGFAGRCRRSVLVAQHRAVLLQVVPGETALAFYKAKNPTDKPIIGISTYNVVPFEAGQYFNKIQVSEHKYEPFFVRYFF